MTAPQTTPSSRTAQRPPRRVALAAALALACAATGAPAVRAQTPSEPQLEAALRERVIRVTKPGFWAATLEVTLFSPPGDGPFPVAVINHGKAAGDPRWQGRARYLLPSRSLVERGFLVVLPMRAGFSKSTGSYMGAGCNTESNGLVQADDVAAVLDHVATLPEADTTRTIVMGQSHGGMVTLALGTLGRPGVLGLVNFAGGLRNTDCVAWEGGLARAFAAYGAKTRVPSLWFYGDNDSYWSRPTWEAMHAAYVGAGGDARMVAFGTFAPGDAHGMFGSRAGQPIWLPEFDRFAASIGVLPARPRADATLR
ncbi:MAG: CocE/NonD family hydrolase [Burkholderiales bacterium]|jgi:dienelactone hydrolase